MADDTDFKLTRFDRLRPKLGYKNNLGYSAAMVDAINSLVDKSEIVDRKRHLKPLNGRVPKTANRGVSGLQPGGVGSGIASPITEASYAARTFYVDPVIIQSSDGIIYMEVFAVNTISMEDANGNPVVLDFKAPV